jgi:hypothetical protein
MTRHLLGACGALAIAGVTLAAQTPSPSQPPPTSPQPTASAAGTITVEGCLKPAGASAQTGTTGTTGTAGAGAAAQFLLTDAMKKPGGTSGATGTTGTTPPAGASAKDEDEYVLRADSASVNLAQHLNHQVEITGRVAPAAAGAPATGTTGAAGAPRSGAGDAPTLTVTAVKMIAATCK